MKKKNKQLDFFDLIEPQKPKKKKRKTSESLAKVVVMVTSEKERKRARANILGKFVRKKPFCKKKIKK